MHRHGRRSQASPQNLPLPRQGQTSGKRLDAAAHAVNLVWNHCNGARHALKHNQRWPGKGETQASTRGAGKLIGIPAQTVQEVCDEYVDRRRGAKKAKLRWRGKRSLGWVPFKNQTITVTGAIVRSNGCKIRLGSIGKSMDESSLVRSPKTRAGVGIAILWPNTNRSPSERMPRSALISASRRA